MTPPFPPSPLIRSQGILYVRVEYHQSQGVSVALGGGPFRPLTTVYEWWLDVQNLGRHRRVTTELLEDGPHLVGADGSDGENEWWIIDSAQSMTEPERQQGPTPYAPASFQQFVSVFSGQGERTMEALRRGQAERITQVPDEFWGTLLIVRRVDVASGNIMTQTIRAEAPHILVDEVVERQGKLFTTGRVTHWEWLEPASLAPDFWLNPPKGIPIGPGNLQP